MNGGTTAYIDHGLSQATVAEIYRHTPTYTDILQTALGLIREGGQRLWGKDAKICETSRKGREKDIYTNEIVCYGIYTLFW